MANPQRIRLFVLLLPVVLAAARTASAQEAAKKGPTFPNERKEALGATKPQKEDASTLNMRRRGRQEIFLTNDVVDNHPAFASIEAATTGVSVGASYLFHRYGHHKLERWTSFVHIGLATSGAVRNYCLKTAHP